MEQDEVKHLTHHISLNEAGEEELAQVSAIGPERAHAIVEYRNEHGPFHNLNELEQVPGMSKDVMDELRSAAASSGSSE